MILGIHTCYGFPIIRGARPAIVREEVRAAKDPGCQWCAAVRIERTKAAIRDLRTKLDISAASLTSATTHLNVHVFIIVCSICPPKNPDAACV